ncbi:hypothetical protein GPDM_00810 [Planococcus donghaensis MPA1U2]|uniref:Uncharacterized protein n=1 Tax=Planococcus donghaensis MPA1U2 TaxID=933115 RepID=E7RCK0_9BACL|nr:hypothetical protein [Planococcus donghaensis]EGA91365.1 hypothetical protein GPDM_00810 [Planococcus donghaensis MPA1U2]
MWAIVFTLLTVVALGISIYKIKTSNTDPKSTVTAMCFFLISGVNLVGYWFDLLGVFTMVLTVALLITGAYFIRYTQTDHKENQSNKERNHAEL